MTWVSDIPGLVPLVRYLIQSKLLARMIAKMSVWVTVKQTPTQMAMRHLCSKRSFTMRRKKSRMDTLMQQVPIRKRNSESQAVIAKRGSFEGCMS